MIEGLSGDRLLTYTCTHCRKPYRTKYDSYGDPCPDSRCKGILVRDAESKFEHALQERIADLENTLDGQLRANDAQAAQIEELKTALQIAVKYLDSRAMDNADFHAVMLANRRPEAHSDD